MPVEGWISLFVVACCVALRLLLQLGPVATSWPTTPRPAATWGRTCGRPAYLRDHLLPSGRLSGWTPDWYAGFPAFTFYMVIPSLAIALLSYVIPYGIAFKLVAISGVVSLPDRRLGLRPADPPALPGAAAARGRRPPPSCSTGRSRSTAATSPRRWPASSRSRSR